MFFVFITPSLFAVFSAKDLPANVLAEIHRSRLCHNDEQIIIFYDTFIEQIVKK